MDVLSCNDSTIWRLLKNLAPNSISTMEKGVCKGRLLLYNLSECSVESPSFSFNSFSTASDTSTYSHLHPINTK